MKVSGSRRDLLFVAGAIAVFVVMLILGGGASAAPGSTPIVFIVLIVLGVIALFGWMFVSALRAVTQKFARFTAATEHGFTVTAGNALDKVRRVTRLPMVKHFRLTGTTDGVPWTLEATSTVRRTDSGTNRQTTNYPILMHWFSDTGRIDRGGALFLADVKAAAAAKTEGRSRLVSGIVRGVAALAADSKQAEILFEMSVEGWTLHPLDDPTLERAFAAFVSDASALSAVLSRSWQQS